MANCVSQLREDWRLARAVHADLVRMGMPRVNVLLTASDGVIENVLEALLPHLADPIARWCPGEELVLPPPSRIGTLILHEVAALSDVDQVRLLHWLPRAVGGHTQVISTTSSPLLPRVDAGAFIDTLFYRLNIISLEATD